jgi:hypothetical protein
MAKKPIESTCIYVYGSGECEQLGIEFGEDEAYEISRARKIPDFDMTIP